MKKYYLNLLPLFAILFSSCEKYLEVELPAHTPKFVVNAILEPGRPVIVFVTQSRGILQDSNFDPVRDATVEVIEDGVTSYFLEFRGVQQRFGNVNGYVADELEIKAGKTYEIIVSGRMETASSKVTIPQPVLFSSVDIQQIGGNIAEITLVFDDPQERNFYEFSVSYSGFTVYEGYGGRMDTMFIAGESWIEPVNPAYNKDYSTRGKVLIDDALFNGREAKLQFTGPLNTRTELDVVVTMKSVTEDYYKYFNTLNLQNYVSGDPLAQPVQVFSNIEGGRGILIGTTPSVHVEKFSFTFD